MLALALLVVAFEPARLQSYAIDRVPYGARAAGIVLTDFALDAQGAVSEIRVLQDVPPFTDLLRQGRWSFMPAREASKPVPAHVLVAGIFRPAMLEFPAPSGPLVPSLDAEAEIPLPLTVEIAPYPPNSLGDAGVMVQVSVSAEGKVERARVVGTGGGFADAALGAARKWTFRPPHRGGSAVPARAYLYFSFRQPL